MPVDPSTLSRSKRIGYYLSDIVLQGIIGSACLLPYRWRVPFVGKLVRWIAPLAGWRKRIRDNLKIARPDLSEADVKQLCRRVPDNVGRTAIEIFSPAEFAQRAANAPLSGEGLEAFEQARAQGRPVVMLTGHFANFYAVRAKLFSIDHKMGALYRRMANPYFNEHYVKKLKAVGEPMFEQGRRGMTHMVRHLKNGGIIGIVSDLHVHGGEELMFFGQPAVTSIANAEMALKYNALLIPVYAIRQPNGLDFEIVMNAPIPHTDPMTMSQALNDDLEALVRQHMDQWFWIHRRWKPWFDRGLQTHPDIKSN